MTGASRGIGCACAIELARAGCDLRLAARDAIALDELAAHLAAYHGVVVKIFPVDLRNANFASDLAVACGHLDILVNNAGDTPGGSLFEIQESAWRDAGN